MLAGVAAATARADEPAAIEAHIIYETIDGLYVDVGTEKGLAEGATGWLASGAVRVARFEVARAAEGSSFLRFLDDRTGPVPAAGEPIAIVLDVPGAAPEEPAVPPTGERRPSPTIKREGDGSDEEPPPPLLAPPDLGEQAFTEARNVFHGRITARQAFQTGTDGGDLDYALTRLRTSGSLERIAETPWVLEWSGQLEYRSGDGLERTEDLYGDVTGKLYQLALFRRYDDRSFVRLGRFLPRELPATGFLDGAHGELAIHETSFRVGAMAGLKPTLDKLEPSLDAPTAVAYATVDVGSPSTLHYFGTLGVLGAAYEGDLDRLAVLLDQRLDSGPFALTSSSELDLDVGSDVDGRGGTRLTRLYLLGTWDVTSALRVGAGVDRFEVPATGPERDAFERAFDRGALDEDEFFEDGGPWRYFVRASLGLPARLRLDGEVSYTDEDEDAGAEDAVRGHLGLTRTGLPFAENGSVTIAVYNLRALETEGYGARLSAHLPFADDRLLLQPALSVRWVEHDTSGGVEFFEEGSEDVVTVDASLRAHWILSSAWSLFAGVSYAQTDDDGRILADFGITWKW